MWPRRPKIGRHTGRRPPLHTPDIRCRVWCPACGEKVLVAHWDRLFFWDSRTGALEWELATSRSVWARISVSRGGARAFAAVAEGSGVEPSVGHCCLRSHFGSSAPCTPLPPRRASLDAGALPPGRAHLRRAELKQSRAPGSTGSCQIWPRVLRRIPMRVH